jgi:hypothetical protein
MLWPSRNSLGPVLSPREISISVPMSATAEEIRPMFALPPSERPWPRWSSAKTS